MKYNPATGRMEDEEGRPALGAGSSFLDQAPPSDVRPEDLQKPFDLGPGGGPTMAEAMLASKGLPPPAAPAVSDPLPPADPAADPGKPLPGAPPPTGGAAPPLPKPSMAVTGTSTTRTESSQKTVMGEGEKEARAKLAETRQGAEGLVERKAEHEREARQGELTIAQQTNQEIAAAEAAAAEQRKKDEETVGRLNARKDDLVKRYGNGEIKDLFARKGHAASFMAAVAEGFGAFGAALAGTENTASKVIARAIENDYQVQKENLAKDREMIAIAKEDAAAHRQVMQDRDLALRTKKVALYDKAIRMRQEEGARMGLSAVDLEKDAETLKLKEAWAKEEADLQAQFREVVTKGGSTTTQRAPTVAAGAGAVSGKTVIGPGGQPIGEAQDEKTARDLSAGLAGYANFRRLALQYRDKIAKHGSELYGKTAGEMEADQGELLMAVRDTNSGLGSLDKGLVEVVSKIIPDATGVSGTLSSKAAMVAKIDRAVQIADQKVKSKLDAAGQNGKDLVPKMLDVIHPELAEQRRKKQAQAR